VPDGTGRELGPLGWVVAGLAGLMGLAWEVVPEVVASAATPARDVAGRNAIDQSVTGYSNATPSGSCSGYSFVRRLIGTPSSLAFRSIVSTYVPKCAAMLAPLFAIEISSRSPFRVNRPGVLPTMTRVTLHLRGRARQTSARRLPRWQRP
jgi:hypothetical protein